MASRSRYHERWRSCLGAIWRAEVLPLFKRRLFRYFILCALSNWPSEPCVAREANTGMRNTLFILDKWRLPIFAGFEDFVFYNVTRICLQILLILRLNEFKVQSNSNYYPTRSISLPVLLFLLEWFYYSCFKLPLGNCLLSGQAAIVLTVLLNHAGLHRKLSEIYQKIRNNRKGSAKMQKFPKW